MPTPQEAAQKWARNTQDAVGRWQAGVNQAAQTGAYCEGISNFLGQPVPGCQLEQQNWSAGVQGAQQRYQQGIQGKADRWLQRYRQRFTG